LWEIKKETFTALWITCYGLREVADYCLSEFGLYFVLLGKFQTDSLEARFGQYRQQYNISLRQVYESEKKLRLLSTLNLKLKDKEITLENFDFHWNDFVCVPNDSTEQLVFYATTIF